MPEENKGVRCEGDEQEPEEQKNKSERTMTDAQLYNYLNRKDTSARDRAEAQRQKEAEIVKLIEESKNLDVSRLEKLAEINAILADFIDSEAWWNYFRSFLEDVCGDKSTESVTIVLKRVEGDRWVMDATVT